MSGAAGGRFSEVVMGAASSHLPAGATPVSPPPSNPQSVVPSGAAPRPPEGPNILQPGAPFLSSSERGAGAAAAPAALDIRGAAPCTPAERCAAAERDLGAITSTFSNTAESHILREINTLKLGMKDSCDKCDRFRAQIAALQAQLPGLATSTRYGAKKVAGACVARSTELKCNILFMRHSESCANVLKRNTRTGGFMQKYYTDPELSARGEAMVRERANGMVGILRAAQIPSPPNKVIVCASALFRAQQTAMHLANGIPSAQRASDAIVVLPYIQETGAGEENKAMTAAERASKGLYAKLPGGADSAARIKTKLFDAAPGASSPSVERFFEWLGCNLEAICEVAGADPASSPVNLVIVAHANLMAELYTKVRKPAGSPPKMRYENLDAMSLNVEYDRFGKIRAPPTIIVPYLQYHESRAIPSSCPAHGCRKPVCPSPPPPPRVGHVVEVPIGEETDTAMCGMIDAIVPGGPMSSDRYRAQIKPVVDRLAANTRPRVKDLRKRFAAYDPPGAFMSMFKKARDPTQLPANITEAKSFFECPAVKPAGPPPTPLTLKVPVDDNAAAAAASSAPAAASDGNTAVYSIGGARSLLRHKKVHRRTRQRRHTHRRHARKTAKK